MWPKVPTMFSVYYNKYTVFQHPMTCTACVAVDDSPWHIVSCWVYIPAIVRDQGQLCGLHVNIIEPLVNIRNPAGNEKLNELFHTSHKMAPEGAGGCSSQDPGETFSFTVRNPGSLECPGILDAWSSSKQAHNPSFKKYLMGALTLMRVAAVAAASDPTWIQMAYLGSCLKNDGILNDLACFANIV